MGCSGLRCTNRGSIAIFPQVSWEFGCVSPPTDFTLSLQKLGCISPPTDFTDLHRWLGCVCSPTEFTEFTEVRLRKSSHRFHGFAQMVGCVCSPTEFTEFTEVLGCCWLRGYGRMPYPPNLCASVPICGRYFSARRFCAFRGFCGRCFSARRFCAFRAFCGRYFSTRRVSSVGDYSFSMRKRLTMPKTRA